MLLYRSMRARQNAYHLQPEDYGSLRADGLFGHMPIVVIAGDFLQIKPAADISIAEDYEALPKAGRKIHDEHDVAQRAILNIPDVIHLRKTKRFLDDDMPALMQAIRASLEEDPISEQFLDKLRGRKIENCPNELDTPLFQEGHVVSMY